MKKEKILLVDDEADILEILSYNLEKEGYKIYTAMNGLKAIEIAERKVPHLVILDVMMPELDGMETCLKMRSIPALKNTLIIFLTARVEDYSQIAAFEAGADDYITKPVKPRVLVSKVKALLRRRGVEEDDQKKIIIRGITLNKERYTVSQKGEEINLPKKEFELLSLLMSDAGKVFSREEIMGKIWGDEVIVGDRTIDVHIRKLREKIGEALIKTIKGVGYKFEA